MAVDQEAIKRGAERLVKFDDAVSLPTDTRDELVFKALREYSRRRPNLTVEAMTGNSTGTYSLPTSYEHGFSNVQEIEFPVDQNPRETIDQSNWDVDKTPSGRRLRFGGYKPGDGQTFWIKFTTPHTFESSGLSEDVPETDQTGIEYLTASLFCQALATFFASKANPNLPEAQVFEYTTRSDEYNTLATKWRTKYDEQIKQEVTGIIGAVKFGRDMYFDRARD